MKNTPLVSQYEIERNREIAENIGRLNNGKNLKYYIESYGCQMNEHDAEKLGGMLINMGYTATEDKNEADIIIFNTCCVREHAELRVFGNIGALKKLKDERPDVIIAVCGCMMQQKSVAEHLYKRYPFVNIVFGTHDIHNFPTFVENALCGDRTLITRNIDGEIPEGLPIRRSGSFSTHVIIMYGCNNFCTYCIVPYVRGRERSRDPQAIIDEVKAVVAQGYTEVTLLGQNVNSYRSSDGQVNFPKLLKMVSEVDGLKRLRFMTSHPKDLSDELIEAMATTNKVCHHIHLPVQSGSNRILKLMNRVYTREKYLETVEKLRSKVKDIEITTDIIVGFPTETDEDFKDTLSLVEQVGYSAAYTFMYSPRKGTRAAEMDDQIPQEVKKQRLKELNDLEASILQKNNLKFIGMKGEVLVEGCDKREGNTMAFGKLSNFKMVYFPGSEDLIGKYLNVEVTDTHHNSLIGKMIEE